MHNILSAFFHFISLLLLLLAFMMNDDDTIETANEFHRYNIRCIGVYTQTYRFLYLIMIFYLLLYRL